MSAYQIARRVCSTLVHLRGGLQIRDFGLRRQIRTQRYYSTSPNPSDLATKVTQWERSFNTRMEGELKKLKDELTKQSSDGCNKAFALGLLGIGIGCVSMYLIYNLDTRLDETERKQARIEENQISKLGTAGCLRTVQTDCPDCPQEWTVPQRLSQVMLRTASK